MGKRRKSREIAMQMLFQADLGRQSAEDVQRTFWQAREKVDPGTQGFAELVSRRHCANRKRLIPTLRRPASIGGWSGWRLLIATCCGRHRGDAGISGDTAADHHQRDARNCAVIRGTGINPFLNGILDAVARALPRTAKQLSPRSVKEPQA